MILSSRGASLCNKSYSLSIASERVNSTRNRTSNARPYLCAALFKVNADIKLLTGRKGHRVNNDKCNRNGYHFHWQRAFDPRRARCIPLGSNVQTLRDMTSDNDDGE